MAHPEPLGWMSMLLTVLNKAARETFDDSYPIEDFRGDKLWVGLEFPLVEANYPGIWVDFDPTGELQTVGINHVEAVEGDDGKMHPVKRWRFAGYASFTVVALTNFQRARLLDEVVKVMAFGEMDPARNHFRQVIEDNAYLGMNFDFDQVGIVGKSEMQGTPWGTDDVVYEISARMECLGEFLSDVATRELVPISAIDVYPFSDQEQDPSTVPPLSLDPGDWR